MYEKCSTCPVRHINCEILCPDKGEGIVPEKPTAISFAELKKQEIIKNEKIQRGSL